MELKNLQTFKAITEEGSFSKAAYKLGYTQSTITFQMQQLEQELSVQLFEKIGRRMLLTKAGDELLPYVNSVLASVDKMKNFKTDMSELSGDLHIMVAETQLCYKMPIIMEKFHALAPKAHLFLRSMNCYDIRDALVAGHIDLGIFYQNVGGFGDSICVHPIGECAMSLVASPSIKEEFPDFITADQKLEVPLIIDEPTCIFRQIFEAYLRERRIVLDHTIELWSIPTIKNLVKSSVGVSYLPSFTVEQELKTGELCEIKTDLENKTITAVYGRHKNKWVSPLMQLFMDLCSAEAQQK